MKLDRIIKTDERYKSPITKRKKLDDVADYTFTPVMGSQRKVKINQTDFTQIGATLDITKDIPLKKN